MTPFAIKMRLADIRLDEVGWTATFYGKPDIHGNSIMVPISDEHLDKLTVGKQYVFVLGRDVGYEEV